MSDRPASRLRGTRCRPYGSDLALRVSANTVRYPDVTIFCEESPTTENYDKRALSRPRVIFEVLSGSTANVDLARVITRLGLQSFRVDRFGSVRDVELPLVCRSPTRRSRRGGPPSSG